MAGMYPWVVLGGGMLGLLVMSYVVYHYFADPKKSYLLATVAVVLSLTVSVLCTLLIPIDIYIISEGELSPSILRTAISQAHVRTAYLGCFSMLLFLAFCVVPFAYFYGQQRRDDGKKVDGCGGSLVAMRSTVFFIAFILILLVISLNFRPGHTETLDKENAVKWVGDLLDFGHSGLEAISFCMACLTSVGVFMWVFYSAYGMAALPFDWLCGRQSVGEQRRDLERTIAGIREKHREIQNKYGGRSDGSLDLSRMKAADRRELNKLQREQKSLSQQNYALQEIEQQSATFVQRLLLCFVPFRLLIGLSMMAVSLLVVSSLMITSIDRALHSPCGWSCGFTSREHVFFNPVDEIFLRLSRIFPADFVLLGIVVVYIFSASIFGIIGLGIRVLCFTMYVLRSRKSLPQALLILCNITAHILLALCMALLTIAPNYTAFGSQQILREGTGLGPSDPLRCSVESQEFEGVTSVNCQPSVISTFFTRISVAMPFFSVAYYFANWAFILVFCGVFLRCLFCQKRQAFLEQVPELEEDEVGLLSFP